MKKRLIFLFIVFVLFMGKHVYATEATDAQKWFCLNPSPISSHDVSLGAYPQGTAGKGSPIPGYPVYVFVKITDANLPWLTTGNPAIDENPQVLGSRGNYNHLKDNLGFRNAGLIGSTNPTGNATTEGLNPATVHWHDDLNGNTTRDHFWYGMQIVPPTQNVVAGVDLGQKFGTFTFERAKGGSDCNYIAWDPFGYVFDAQTLGPIKGAKITIYNMMDNGTSVMVPQGTGPGKVAMNPFYTNENGSYTFFTDKGKYKLVIEGSFNGKPLEIEDITKVNTDYPAKGYDHLYAKDAIIDEKEVNGVVETVRADIPVKTVGAPTLYPQLVDVNIDRSGEQITIRGKVTVVPADVVFIYKDLATGQTKEGPEKPQLNIINRSFAVTVNQTIEGTYTFSEIQVRQATIPLTNKGIGEKAIAFFNWIQDKLFSAHAQGVSTVKINPIPSYIEGIARGANGEALPFVMVGIYLQGSEAPAYQTRSDVNGHYSIGSQFIPPLSYEIRIKKTTGEVIKMSTTEYLKQNTDFHKANSINSFSTIQKAPSTNTINAPTLTKEELANLPQGNSQATTNRSKTGASAYSPNLKVTQPPQTISGGGTMGAGMQGIVMIIAVIMVLVMIGVGAFIMMKSKQQAPSQY